MAAPRGRENESEWLIWTVNKGILPEKAGQGKGRRQRDGGQERDLMGIDEIRKQLARAQATGEELQGELAETGRGLAALALELEQRVDARTAELNQRSLQLESANTELEAFCYSVSHDLRAPLRAIDGFSRILLKECDGRLDVEGRHHLQRVREATQRMDQLITDLLMLSRVSRDELRRGTVNLSALARAVGTDLANVAEHPVEFIVAPDVTGRGDARLLRIALVNLLGNAWKFTSRQPAARVEFGVTADGGATACFVRDNGAGFDRARAQKLFGAFQRFHAETEFPGAGIGLATVQRIIHRHGGRVWAEAQPGQGATFYFTLPPPPPAHSPQAAMKTNNTELKE